MRPSEQRLAAVRRATDAYLQGLQIPSDASDTEDNRYACVVGALFKASLKPTSLVHSLMRSEKPAGCISSLKTGRAIIINNAMAI